MRIQNDEEYKDLTYKIIGAAYEVRKTLGRFLMEKSYEQALQSELKIQGISSERQVYLPVYYKGECLEQSYRIDLLVEKTIPIELKTVDLMTVEHFCQLLSYLKFGNFKFGYLMNFKSEDFSTDRVPSDFYMTKGIYRVIL